MGELLLVEDMQDIGLVFARINATPQPALTRNRMVIHAHIMSCRHIICIKRECPVKHYCEADVAVACQTRVGRAASDVLFVEHVHDRMLELLLNVNEVKWNIEHTRDASCIIN